MKMQPKIARPADSVTPDPPQQAHKPLTRSQNLILTIKVLLVAAIVIAGIVALGKFSE
jgi:hypothetical protein